MKKKEINLQSKEGVKHLKDELDRFYDRLETKKVVMEMRYPQCSINLRANKPYTGYCLTFERYTLVAQHYIHSIESVNESYLSLAIFKLHFNDKGLALGLDGIPLEGFDPSFHAVANTTYAYTLLGKEGAWVDSNAKAGPRFTTQELLDKWGQVFLDYATLIE